MCVCVCVCVSGGCVWCVCVCVCVGGWRVCGVWGGGGDSYSARHRGPIMDRKKLINLKRCV